MYLKKKPTLFTKDGETREVFHTVTADELKKAGWSIVEDKAEPAPEVAEDSYEEEEREAIQSVEEEEELDMMLGEMTKAGLLNFALEKGIRVDPHSKKDVIINVILEGIDEVERG